MTEDTVQDIIDMIDIARLVKDVRDIAADSPDFIYIEQPVSQKNISGGASCSYVCGTRFEEVSDVLTQQKYLEKADNQELGSPCIVGTALQQQGISTYERLLLDETLGPIDIVLEERKDKDQWGTEILWLTKVQQKQDRGKSWGRAVHDSEKYL